MNLCKSASVPAKINKEQAGKQNLGTFTISLDRVIFDADGLIPFIYQLARCEIEISSPYFISANRHFSELNVKSRDISFHSFKIVS